MYESLPELPSPKFIGRLADVAEFPLVAVNDGVIDSLVIDMVGEMVSGDADAVPEPLIVDKMVACIC